MLHPVAALFLNQFSSLALMFIAVMLMGGIPRATAQFFLLVLCSSVLDSIVFVSSYWAIKQTRISLLAPLSSFTPALATSFGAIILHETPTLLKFLAVITIIGGAYLLNIVNVKGGMARPLQAMFCDTSVKLYFVRAVLFGITPIFQKQAIFQTDPIMRKRSAPPV
jgi:uncharacterized membrane protein